MDANEQYRLKVIFAKLLLQMNDPAKAAFATTPDTSLALQIAYHWPKDSVVVAEQQKLVQSGPSARELLPSKETQARDIYNIATSDRVSAEDRLKAHRLYAEVMGHIERPTDKPTGVLVQNVMVVPVASNMDDWQKLAMKQQDKLIEHAATTIQ